MGLREPNLLVMVTVLSTADFVTHILPAVIDVANLLLGSAIKVMVADAYVQKNKAPVPVLLSETISIVALDIVTLTVPSLATSCVPVKISPLFETLLDFIL